MQVHEAVDIDELEGRRDRKHELDKAEAIGCQQGRDDPADATRCSRCRIDPPNSRLTLRADPVIDPRSHSVLSSNRGVGNAAD
jgi:hypothetical protein